MKQTFLQKLFETKEFHTIFNLIKAEFESLQTMIDCHEEQLHMGEESNWEVGIETTEKDLAEAWEHILGLGIRPSELALIEELYKQ